MPILRIAELRDRFLAWPTLHDHPVHRHHRTGAVRAVQAVNQHRLLRRNDHAQCGDDLLVADRPGIHPHMMKLEILPLLVIRVPAPQAQDLADALILGQCLELILLRLRGAPDLHIHAMKIRRPGAGGEQRGDQKDNRGFPIHDCEITEQAVMDKQVMTINAAGLEAPDQVVIEEPLQIVVDGRSVAVTMRTPGHDAELALGFLRTEGVISSLDQVSHIATDSRDNHALVFLAEGTAVDFDKLTRHVFSASSCGLCGKATIDAVTQALSALPDGAIFPKDSLLRAPELLASAQSVFARTGGLHAAGIFSADGTMHVVREDIGRHNAVDKVLGWSMQAGFDLAHCFLLVSGRVSFEIMQKALAGGIPLVAAISAPSSLAIEFAEQANQTLVAFLRPPAFKIYAGLKRIA